MILTGITHSPGFVSKMSSCFLWGKHRRCLSVPFHLVRASAVGCGGLCGFPPSGGVWATGNQQRGEQVINTNPSVLRVAGQEVVEVRGGCCLAHSTCTSTVSTGLPRGSLSHCPSDSSGLGLPGASHPRWPLPLFRTRLASEKPDWVVPLGDRVYGYSRVGG